MTTTTPKAVLQVRNVRALLRKLDEEYNLAAVQGTTGNLRAKIQADEINRMRQRIEACLDVKP